MHLLRPALTSLFLLAAAIAAAQPAPDGRTRERERLAAATDRDSRIAAALLTLPADGTSAPSDTQARAAVALLEPLRDDALTLYVAATICQRNAACGDTTAAQRLIRHAPDNALHWLLTPDAPALSDETLQRAAASRGAAEPHLGELLALLRRALDGSTKHAWRHGCIIRTSCRSTKSASSTTCISSRCRCCAAPRWCSRSRSVRCRKPRRSN